MNADDMDSELAWSRFLDEEPLRARLVFWPHSFYARVCVCTFRTEAVGTFLNENFVEAAERFISFAKILLVFATFFHHTKGLTLFGFRKKIFWV